MDSLLANYASDDDDDERGGVVQEEKFAAESLQLPSPKPSAAFSSSLFSTLPPPRSLASASSHPPTIPSWSTPSHLGELDGDKEESGILATGTPSSTAFKAQSSLFSSLPPPKPSSSFSGPTSRQLGGERSEEEEDKADVFTTYTTSSNSFSAQKSMFSSIPPPKDTSTPSLFSSVAPPKFEQPNPLNIGNPPSSDRNPKKVVQFKLPLNPSLLKSEDSDDEEDNVNMRKRSVKDSSSNVPGASSSLFSILPAPKSTLGVVPSSATASSRRSVIDADFSASNTGEFTVAMENSAYGESGADEYYRGGWADAPTEIGAEDVNATGFVDSSAGGWDPLGMEEATHPGYDGSNAASYWDPSYGGAIDYGSYEGNWSETAAAVNSDVPELGRIAGKRGRNEFPSELMEVNQDELMKNRPRQDQSRLTGIAFGPSHQPASSAKGKPSKLHKRKHQIGSLFFDMKQKEMELAERRSRGLLTKAETQANISDPFTEIPTDVLLFQICIPFAIEHFKLRATIKSLLRHWFSAVGWALGLTDYLLPQSEENGTQDADQPLVPRIAAEDLVRGDIVGNADALEEPDIDDQADSEYSFVLRIVLLLVLAWMTLLLFNSAMIILPVSLGRGLFNAIPRLPITHGFKCNDLFAFSIGCYLIWTIVAGMRYSLECIRTRRVRVLVLQIWKWFAIILKSSALLSIWIFVIPVLIGLLFELLVIVPLRVPVDESPVFLLYQDWALGLIFLKIWTRLVILDQMAPLVDENWRRKFERVREDGFSRLRGLWVLREIMIPIISKLLTALCIPYVFAKGVFPIFGYSLIVNSAVYRFSWLGCLLFSVTCFCAKRFHVWFTNLHNSIRDDRYLIGRRLHNFGEDIKIESESKPEAPEMHPANASLIEREQEADMGMRLRHVNRRPNPQLGQAL